MQQPDFRDQLEPEANDETEENSQSDSNELQNQETSQLQHEEKETDGAKVRGSKAQSVTLWHAQRCTGGLKFQSWSISRLTANTVT